jgi:ubiquinone/menaquinone biosynthesis C-methylase UbiE
MAVAALGDVVPLLRCPRCGLAVAAGRDAFRCVDPACRCSAPGSFPLVDRWPVLVDFERSVLDRAELTLRSARVRQELHRSRADRLPRSVRRIWKPPNRTAQANVRDLLARLDRPSRVLVVGGGTLGNGVEELYTVAGVEVIGFDLYGSDLTQLVADAHAIPLASGCVDAVVVQAVLEHVLDPALVVAEIHRVLRPDGLVYAETPFLQQVHAGRYDFTRFTASGHRYLFRRFTQIAAGPVAGPGTALLWTADHVVRGLTGSALAGRFARAALFWLRLLDRWIPAEYASDSASALFFLGQRSTRELTAEEVVAYYPGAQRD